MVSIDCLKSRYVIRSNNSRNNLFPPRNESTFHGWKSDCWAALVSLVQRNHVHQSDAQLLQNISTSITFCTWSFCLEEWRAQTENSTYTLYIPVSVQQTSINQISSFSFTPVYIIIKCHTSFHIYCLAIFAHEGQVYHLALSSHIEPFRWWFHRVLSSGCGFAIVLNIQCKQERKKILCVLISHK